MKILAIETASRLGGLAVLDSNVGLIASTRLNVLASHSETLMVEIDHILKLAGLGPMEIDVLAVSSGPGAFTGLRVGLGTAKGIAFATGARVVAVPTLEAYAMSLPYDHLPVAPMLDARKREVYAALFIGDGDKRLKRMIPEAPFKPADFINQLGDLESVLFAGEGAIAYRDIIKEQFKGKAHFAPEPQMHLDPSSVALLGLKMAQANEYSDPKKLSPIYLRKSEAETPRPKKG
jgi:tRNA threonylcarbamoyladenosine biosynthesis protein TsaB